MHYISQARPGDLIWAAWQRGGASTISHMGVTTKMINGHPYITQHTNNRLNEPFYKAAGQQTWRGSNPSVSVWIAQPQQKY